MNINMYAQMPRGLIEVSHSLVCNILNSGPEIMIYSASPNRTIVNKIQATEVWWDEQL